MMLSDIEIGKNYILHDHGLRTHSGATIAPEHDLVVVVTGKSQHGIYYRVLPDQYNPIGYSCESDGSLYPLGLRDLREIGK